MVQPYNGITKFAHKKKWNINPCSNTDEPWKHYAKWKKPGIKGHMLWFNL